MTRSSRLTFGTIAVIAALAGVLAPAAHAQNNECDQPGEFPDVIVGSLHQVNAYGSNGNFSAYSVGTNSCNIGTCQLQWFAGNNLHPVIGQNMFRLKDGRFEHIGQSWLKHGFTALSQSLCSSGCIPTNGTYLGVNCSDPYSAGLNGQQSNLGPKFEVNANKGIFPYPATNLGQTGNNIFKRLQVPTVDVDPTENIGARYFVEGQYVTLDDAGAGKQDNNASWREVTVTPGSISFPGGSTTNREEPGIFAWATYDPTVQLNSVRVPGEGLLYLASKVTDNGDGTWRYEYAMQNLNSHRSIRSFSIPVLAGVNVTDIGFHDVHYHSGEPWDGTDWPATVANDAVTWNTDLWADNTTANALRWGTLYNFRFDAEAPPAAGDVTLGVFLPGTPTEFTAPTQVPLCDGDFDNDGLCDLVDADDDGDGVDDIGDSAPLDPNVCRDLDADTCDDCSSGTDDPANDGVDTDSDGLCDAGDCAPTIPGADPPSPVGATLVLSTTVDAVRLDWTSGAGSETSNVYAGSIQGGQPWAYDETCLASGLADPTYDDNAPQAPGAATYFLVGASNGCGESSIGEDSSQTEIFPSIPCE